MRYILILTLSFIFACNSQPKTDAITAQEQNDPFGTSGIPTVSLPGAVVHGKKAQQEFRPGQKNGLKFDAAGVDLDGNEIDQKTTIGIEYLDSHELPALEPGMTNVTKGPRRGYRFTPTPRTFADNVQVTLPYDAALIPKGVSDNDVRTYYYDTNSQHWQALDRTSIDTVNRTITSDSNHFTDMINATVTVPDHPEAVSFNPTQIKDIKAADPGTGINLIDPPQANNMGDARMNYPIEIPPGRQGMQPQLNVSYNSAGGVGGNGWMGLGWDLSIPSVSVDTRWGVPRYSPGEETETYTLNGEQLTPVAHRTLYITRTTDRIFHSRIEGVFRRIIRRGSHPNNYTWEITEKNGTRHLYGACNPGAETLADGVGNRFLWALCETRDTNGNFIRYTYTIVTHPGVPGGVPGSNIYPQSINYTGSSGTSGAYTVTFTRDQARNDVQIDARGGFKRVTADLLKRVDITLNGQLVRRYSFGYNENPYGDGRPGTAFQKTLLTSISQHMADGALFNKHTLTYYDEARNPAGSYFGFQQSTPWSIPGDGISAGLFGEGGASAIGGNKSDARGGHIYVGVGLISSLVSKNLTAGFKTGFDSSNTETLITLTDINGDGLPDKVFKSGGGFSYRPNISTSTAHSFGAALQIPSLTSIGSESMSSTTFGGEMHLEAPILFTHNSATTQSDTYLSDVNGDGILDVVSGGQVQFGYLTGGVPAFSTDSNNTPAPIHAGGSINIGNIYGDPIAIEAERAQNFPLIDTVRRWTAPYSGVIRIEGTAKLVQDTSPARAAYTKADGVRVAIQHEGSELVSKNIAATDYSPHTLAGVSSITVTAGERIYFRVGSRFDGAYDVVEWDPEITYTSVASGSLNSALKDANGLFEYKYRASTDFTLAGRNITTTLPVTGTLHIAGTFVKSAATSDDVALVILKGNTEIFRQTLAHSEIRTVMLSQDIAVNQLDTLEWKVVTDSPIDATKISVTPVAWYTAAPGLSRVTDEAGNYLLQVTAPYTAELYPTRVFPTTTPPTPVVSAPQESYTVPGPPASTRAAQATVTLEFTGMDAHESRSAVVTLKKRGALLAKKTITATRSGGPSKVTVSVSLDANVTTGDEIFMTISSRDAGYAAKLTQVTTDIQIDNVTTNLPYAVYTTGSAEIFAQPFRGWSVAGYKAVPPRDMLAIDQSSFVMNTDPQQNANNIQAYAAFARPDTAGTDNKWVSVDDAVWVSAAQISSSRMGMKDIRVPSSSQFSGAGAPPRISESSSDALGIGASFTNGTSRSVMDFQDLNGDRFPDVISGGGVQYTTPTGGLETARRDGILDTSRQSDNSGFSVDPLTLGAMVATIADPKGNSSATPMRPAMTAQSESNMPSFGVMPGTDFSQASSDTQFDLLDINGDGLPDKVYGDGMAQLNMGYSFGPKENWGAGTLASGQTVSKNIINAGVNVENYSIGAGISVSRSTTQSNESYADINGDGLPDKVMGGSPLMVRLNTGTGFTGAFTWSGGHGGIATDRSITLGGGAYFTFGFPCCFIPIIKFVFNPGGHFSTTMGRSELTFRDIDGDGFVDHVRSGGDNELHVAANPIGRTNMLKKVNRPMGATITLEYTRDGNTYELPHSRYNLTRVTVFDGHAGEGTDTQVTAFEYQAPHYNRLEREFFGYGNVIEKHLDTANNNTIYRSISRTFLTNSYYAKGLLQRERIADAAGRLFAETENTYVLHDVIHNVSLGLASNISLPLPVSTTATIFPQLIRTEKKFYEGTGSAGKNTYTTNEYDSFGNITRFTDTGDHGAVDDVDATVTYSNCQPNYIIEPIEITVRGGGSVMRRRESVMDCNTGNVSQVKQYVDGSNAAITDLTYEANGNLKEVIGPENKSGQRYKLTYEYDAVTQSQVTRIADSFGLTSTAAYDLRYGKPTTTTDTNGQQTTYVYDNAGRSTSLVGPYEQALGQTTISFEYHPEAAVPYALTKHIDKNAAGNTKVSGTIDTILFIDGLKRVLQTKKDSTVRGTNGQPKDVMIVTGQVKFDAFGRTTEQYYPVTENKGGSNTNYNTEFDTVAPTRTVFDVLDRSTQTTLPDATITTSAYGFGYDRQGLTQFETRVTDALGKQKFSYRDVKGLITSIKEQNGSQPIQTSYRYDALKQITQVVDDKLNTTLVAYDNLGRRTRIDNPDAGVTDSVYDLAGNLVQKITNNLRAQNKAIEYDYDFNRLLKIRYPVFTQNNVTYTYGAPNLAGNANGNRAGRVTMVTDASGIEERFYGPLGETVKEIKTIPAALTLGSGEQIYTSEYTYDTWNRMLTVTFPDGGSELNNRETLTYAYDSGGLVTAATGKKGNKNYNYLAELHYDKFGQRVFMELGNGVKTTYTYRADNRRLDNLRSQLPNPSQYVFQNISYTYDAVGNITQLMNDVIIPANLQGNDKKIGHAVGGPSTQSFTYDDLYRLTGATGSYKNRDNQTNRYTLAMTYDSIHNITRKQQVNDIANQGGNANTINNTTYNFAYHYMSPKPHAASDTGPFDMLYDGNGNLTRRENRDNNQVRQLIWDEENRLACTQENKQQYLPQTPESCVPAGSANEGFYIYNAEGERIFKNNGKRQFSINQNYTEMGSAGYKHIFIGNQRLITKKAESGDHLEQLSWFYSVDHLGSTSYLTNAQGQLQEYIGYTPSGEAIIREHPSQPMDYGLSGNQMDSETGYYAFSARYYDPRTGVWTSTDPALEQLIPGVGGDGGNLPGYGGIYNSANLALLSYVHNRPVIYRDPDGKAPQVAAGAVLVTAGIVGAAVGIVVQAGADIYHGELSNWSEYAGAATGGAAGGMASLFCGPLCASAIGGATSNVTQQLITGFQGEQMTQEERAISLGTDTLKSGIVGYGLGLGFEKVMRSFVPNSVKGKIGEGLSALGLGATGQGILRRNAENTVGKSSFDFLTNSGKFVESKFGTAKLSTAQRAAAAKLGSGNGKLEIHFWRYQNVGGWLGSGTGAGIATDK